MGKSESAAHIHKGARGHTSRGKMRSCQVRGEQRQRHGRRSWQGNRQDGRLMAFRAMAHWCRVVRRTERHPGNCKREKRQIRSIRAGVSPPYRKQVCIDAGQRIYSLERGKDRSVSELAEVSKSYRTHRQHLPNSFRCCLVLTTPGLHLVHAHFRFLAMKSQKRQPQA